MGSDIKLGKLLNRVIQRIPVILLYQVKCWVFCPGQINRDASVILMVKQKDKEGKMLFVPVESNGTFNDPATIIFDTAQVYYSFQKAK